MLKPFDVKLMINRGVQFRIQDGLSCTQKAHHIYFVCLQYEWVMLCQFVDAPEKKEGRRFD